RLRPIIPDNACILCITAAAGTELADAYSPDTVIASSPGKEVYDLQEHDPVDQQKNQLESRSSQFEPSATETPIHIFFSP
ncbi:hypothetical protein Tco_1168928, partial [Tanacetum coccineum]